MVIVVVAGFAPWGSMEMTPSSEFNNFVSQLSKAFGGPENATAVPFDGWHSELSLFGAQIPNWLIAIYAAAIVAAVWTKSPPKFVAIVAAIGVLHTGIVCITALTSKFAHPGVGSFIAFAAFAICLLFAVWEMKRKIRGTPEAIS